MNNAFDRLLVHIGNTTRRVGGAGDALREFMGLAVAETLIPEADCRLILDWEIDCKRDTATFEAVQAYESRVREIFSSHEVSAAVERWIKTGGQSPRRPG